jgi:Arc/MetJ-type ribon-helix-helix transcriptional regulator
VPDCNTICSPDEEEILRESVTVSMPTWLKDKLDQAVRKERLNRSEIVREALQEYFAVRDFRGIREKMIPEAEAKGLFTDEDVFREVS